MRVNGSPPQSTKPVKMPEAEASTTAAEPPAAPAAGASTEESIEKESTAVFEPVVQLDEVEVKSGEEEEETVFKMCAFGTPFLSRISRSCFAGARSSSALARRFSTKARARSPGASAAWGMPGF